MAELFRISSERLPGAESFVDDSIGDDSQDEGQDKSIQQLRSLLIESSLAACQHSTCSVDDGCGSCSPITSSCSTPPNGEDSGLSMSVSSEESVGSSIPDELNQSPLRCDVGDQTGAVAKKNSDFFLLRITYLLVTLVIMLADGLQGKIYICSYERSLHTYIIIFEIS